MSRTHVTVHFIELLENGRHTGTLAHAYSPQAAAAFVETYNRLGRRRGRSARIRAQQIAIPPHKDKALPS